MLLIFISIFVKVIGYRLSVIGYSCSYQSPLTYHLSPLPLFIFHFSLSSRLVLFTHIDSIKKRDMRFFSCQAKKLYALVGLIHETRCQFFRILARIPYICYFNPIISDSIYHLRQVAYNQSPEFITSTI